MKTKFFFLFLLVFLSFSVNARNKFRVMFYNVENLFDTEDDKHKNDNEFLPEGRRNWTQRRYGNKLTNIAKVISAAGDGLEIPAIVGLCEVENDRVLTDLTRYSLLKKWNYRFVVTDSPDDRGIDVALLYQRNKFKYIDHRFYRLTFPYNPRKKTRDILYVTGLTSNRDTLDVFVCHFPSRRGGEEKSEPDRIYAASVLKKAVDSLYQIRCNANIIIMGDFNDEPSNRSIRETLGAMPAESNAIPQGLYNLFAHFEKVNNRGSYKFGRAWNMLDQIIVSGNLLDSANHLHVVPQSAAIFSRDYMLTDDRNNGGKRPKKTFHGNTHEDGYSDHLPIIADFISGK